jgi:hypothetical protein
MIDNAISLQSSTGCPYASNASADAFHRQAGKRSRGESRGSVSEIGAPPVQFFISYADFSESKNAAHSPATRKKVARKLVRMENENMKAGAVRRCCTSGRPRKKPGGQSIYRSGRSCKNLTRPTSAPTARTWRADIIVGTRHGRRQ